MKNKNKIILLILIYISSASLIFAETPDFDPVFSLSTNDDLTVDDFYELKGDLKMTFPATDDIELIFKTEHDKYEVDVEELSFLFSINNMNSIKAGKFENKLTLDDYLGSFDSPFARNTLLTRELKNQGYVTRSIGLKYERKNRKSDDLSWFGQFIYVPSQFEPQLDFGFLFREKDNMKLKGILVSYYPFINHDAWAEGDADSNLHNFLVDLIWTDYTNSIIYGAELTAGSNLINPVGLLNHDPDTDFPFFIGGDLHAGIRYLLDKERGLYWTPLLRITVFEPEISEFECRDIDLIYGNRFEYQENVRLHVDGGLGFVTRYDEYGDNELKTKMEWRWAISIVIKG